MRDDPIAGAGPPQGEEEVVGGGVRHCPGGGGQELESGGYTHMGCQSRVNSVECGVNGEQQTVHNVQFKIQNSTVQYSTNIYPLTALHCRAMYCSLLRHAETSGTPGSRCPSHLTGCFFVFFFFTTKKSIFVHKNNNKKKKQV